MSVVSAAPALVFSQSSLRRPRRSYRKGHIGSLFPWGIAVWMRCCQVPATLASGILRHPQGPLPCRRPCPHWSPQLDGSSPASREDPSFSLGLCSGIPRTETALTTPKPPTLPVTVNMPPAS